MAEQETTIEGVLRARGYADCVATIHEDTANVLVRAEALTRQETAVILELVLRETDVDRQCQDHSNKLKQTICQRRDFLL